MEVSGFAETHLWDLSHGSLCLPREAVVFLESSSLRWEAKLGIYTKSHTDRYSKSGRSRDVQRHGRQCQGQTEVKTAEHTSCMYSVWARRLSRAVQSDRFKRVLIKKENKGQCLNPLLGKSFQPGGKGGRREAYVENEDHEGHRE